MRTRESVETEGAETMSEVETKNQIKERKVSWAKLRRVDSLNLEAGRVSMTHSHGSQVTAMLYIHIHSRPVCHSIFILASVINF